MSKFTKTYAGRTWTYNRLDPDQRKLEPDEDDASEASSKPPDTHSSSVVKSRSNLRVVSYNVFADYKCASLRYSAMKNIHVRVIKIFEEIKAYDPHVICLQDVDDFVERWRPGLMKLGYDCVYKQRTSKTEYFAEGVVVAYRRDLFQLFKAYPIELNNASTLAGQEGGKFRTKCYTDNVALLTFLQPWKVDFYNSGLCICSAMFTEKEGYSDVRDLQVQYLMKQIEIANCEFQVPVVMGVALYEGPHTSAYHILRTGRIPLTAAVPQTCQPPRVQPLSRASAKVSWLPPPRMPADSKVLSYKVCWRPGGSRTIGFRFNKMQIADDCQEFVTKVDAKGDSYTAVMDELSMLITGLTSEIPYEFKVLATNDVGDGAWSEASIPVVLPNPPSAPEMPPLVFLRNMEQVSEIREQSWMGRDDWDVEVAVASNPLVSNTQLTPRDVSGKKEREAPRGRALPISSNPREGWLPSLGGGCSGAVQEEVKTSAFLKSRTMLRSLSSEYSDVVSDTKHGRVAVLPRGAEERFVETKELADALDDDTIMDLKDVAQTIGKANRRQVHSYTFRSAYEDYCTGAEPLYSMCAPPMYRSDSLECADFIFYSSDFFKVAFILPLPPLVELNGADPRQSVLVPDSCWLAPPPSLSPLFLNNLKVDGISKAQRAALKKKIREAVHSSVKAANNFKYRERELETNTSHLTAEALTLTVADSSSRGSSSQDPSRPGTQGAAADGAGSNPLSRANTRSAVDSRSTTPSTRPATTASAAAPQMSQAVPVSDVFMGGAWVPHLMLNNLREMHWLPDNNFASRHMALGAELQFLDSYLPGNWH